MTERKRTIVQTHDHVIRLQDHDQGHAPTTGVSSIPQIPRTQPRRHSRAPVFQFVVPIVAFLALVLMIFFVMRLVNSSRTTEREAAQLIASVGELMILPADEVPTIATVSDLNALKDQPFFKYAEVGDQVLMYAKAQKAIIYSPRKHKIVEVGPITTESQ